MRHSSPAFGTKSSSGPNPLAGSRGITSASSLKTLPAIQNAVRRLPDLPIVKRLPSEVARRPPELPSRVPAADTPAWAAQMKDLPLQLVNALISMRHPLSLAIECAPS